MDHGICRECLSWMHVHTYPAPHLPPLCLSSPRHLQLPTFVRHVCSSFITRLASRVVPFFYTKVRDLSAILSSPIQCTYLKQSHLTCIYNNYHHHAFLLPRQSYCSHLRSLSHPHRSIFWRGYHHPLLVRSPCPLPVPRPKIPTNAPSSTGTAANPPAPGPAKTASPRPLQAATSTTKLSPTTTSSLAVPAAMPTCAAISPHGPSATTSRTASRP